MKYHANPAVEVDAFKILAVKGGQGDPKKGASYNLAISDDDGSGVMEAVIATPEMCARMVPRVGDYWVIQSDGYIYLNPKEVFERKYLPGAAVNA